VTGAPIELGVGSLEVPLAALLTLALSVGFISTFVARRPT
jgi:hypothetical protein